MLGVTPVYPSRAFWEHRKQWSSLLSAWPVIDAWKVLAVSTAVAVSSAGQPIGIISSWYSKFSTPSLDIFLSWFPIIFK